MEAGAARIWGSLGKCPHFGPKLLVPSAGWNQIFLIFTGSGHPFIHLSILLQSLWKTLLQVMVRGTTDRQTLFRCQEVYSVLITYNMFHRICLSTFKIKSFLFGAISGIYFLVYRLSRTLNVQIQR